MRVAVHQPNFCPWLGLFHRIGMVDRFVFFDHVQAMRGKSWLSRNKLLVGGEARWLTVPVYRAGRGLQAVSEVEIDYGSGFVRKHLRTITTNYGQHPHFESVFPLVEDLYGQKYRHIAQLNKQFITKVAQALGLTAEFVDSSSLTGSDLELSRLSGNALVVATCSAAGATEYISGEGCKDFIEPAEFERAGVSFAFQRFLHPSYLQAGTDQFVSHLSVLDALFNLGAAGCRHLVSAPTGERAFEAEL